MKIYIDEKERYKDMKSTGFSFTLVGALGIIALILIWMGIIPLNLATFTKYLMTVVMGVLFLVFFIVGITSYLSLKKIKENIGVQADIQAEIIRFFTSDTSYFDELVYDEDCNDEEKYLLRYDFLLLKLTEKYPDVAEETADHLVETIISKIDDEKMSE